jgi:HicB family
MPRKPTALVQINLRIREALRRRLDVAAEANETSLNQEMVNRLEKSFENEDLRPQVKHLHDMLDAFTLKQQRDGPVLAGFFFSELRKLKGVSEQDARRMAETARMYLGGAPGQTKLEDLT